MQIQPLEITAYTAVSSLGDGLKAQWHGLEHSISGLELNSYRDRALPTWIGKVAGLEEVPVAAHLQYYDCRNHRLAQRALQQDGFANAVAAARERYGPARIAVLMGTSTSGIESTELAYADGNPQLEEDFPFRSVHMTHALGEFVQRFLMLEGPAMTMATACSSSAKVFASAARLLRAGYVDAAVVGGVDSLCYSTLYGFSSLELVSTKICRPFDKARDGLNIGEAAAFFLLQRDDNNSGLYFEGYGESSDAYHMSTPSPDGRGPFAAMSAALACAGLQPDDIGYLNLHGTATRINDQMEDQVVTRLFGNKTACSSTKGWTGHTLGAAGALEAAFCCLSLINGVLPGTLNCNEIDPAFNAAILLQNQDCTLHHVMSNSFGFGGSNCSLIFGHG